MHFPSLFVILVYISFYLCLIFGLICLACGLYYIIDLTEEHTVLTKKLIKLTSTITIILHPLLYLYEKLPFFPCFVSFLAHVSHRILLQTFPYISPTSIQFFSSFVLFVTSNFTWISTFRDHEIFYQYRVAPFPATVAFIILIVWLVPAALLCSLSSNDNVLPGVAPAAAEQKHPRRKNAVMNALESISQVVRKMLGMAPQDDFGGRDPYTHRPSNSPAYMR